MSLMSISSAPADAFADLPLLDSEPVPPAPRCTSRNDGGDAAPHPKLQVKSRSWRRKRTACVRPGCQTEN